MKSSLLLLVLMGLVLFGQAQENKKEHEIQTLFSNQKSIGFYGSFSIGYSHIDGQDALVSGGRAAIIFNHNVAIGLGGYGFVNNLDEYNMLEESPLNYSLAGGYGGFFIEPIVNGLKPVHVSFPVLFAIGGVAVIENFGSDYWQDHYMYDYPENDLFFVVEPAVELEFNLTRFFRTAATFSYRFTQGFDLVDIDDNAISGTHNGLTFKFGKF